MCLRDKQALGAFGKIVCFLYNLCLITVLSHLVMGTTGSGSILEENIEQFDSVAIKQCLAKCSMYGFCDFIVYDSEHLRCDLPHDGSIPPSSTGSILRPTDQACCNGSCSKGKRCLQERSKKEVCVPYGMVDEAEMTAGTPVGLDHMVPSTEKSIAIPGLICLIPPMLRTDVPVCRNPMDKHFQIIASKEMNFDEDIYRTVVDVRFKLPPKRNELKQNLWCVSIGSKLRIHSLADTEAKTSLLIDEGHYYVISENGSFRILGLNKTVNSVKIGLILDVKNGILVSFLVSVNGNPGNYQKYQLVQFPEACRYVKMWWLCGRSSLIRIEVLQCSKVGKHIKHFLNVETFLARKRKRMGQKK